MENVIRDRSSERGSAGVKFAIVLVVIVLVANAGYNYIPTAYEAEGLKADMSAAVLQGLAMPGKMNPVDNVKLRIERAMVVNQAPPDATLSVTMKGTVIQARVTYVKDVSIVPFGIYNYKFQFDNTATPTGFLLKQ